MSRNRPILLPMRFAVLIVLSACRFIVPLPGKLQVIPAGPFSPGGAGHQALTVATPGNLGYSGDVYQWSDLNGTQRKAILVRNDRTDPFGTSGGYLRELSYVMPSGAVRNTAGTGQSGWYGYGYVVNHFDGASVNSKGVLGQTRTVFAGRHHAIHEFTLRMQPGGPVDVTVQWFFATGRSHPVYAITYDSNPAGDQAVRADSRAPYGDYAFDGNPDGPGDLSGVGWGDRYLFRTTSGSPVSMLSSWDYTLENRIPHVIMWSDTADAEMGAVQTQPFDVHPAGGDYGGGAYTACAPLTSSTRGDACSEPGEQMPAAWIWPYQLNQYTLDEPKSRRIAWGTSYGAVGQRFVQTFGRQSSGFPFQSYSLVVVLDAHSRDAVMSEVVEMERVADATLRAVKGTVVTEGPGGVGGADDVTLSPAGWNHVYGAWLVDVEDNAVDLTLTVPNGELHNPIFELRGWEGSTVPSSVTWQGEELAADSGYFASIDAATGEVWITVNGTLSGTNRIVVSP